MDYVSVIIIQENNMKNYTVDRNGGIKAGKSDENYQEKVGSMSENGGIKSECEDDTRKQSGSLSIIESEGEKNTGSEKTEGTGKKPEGSKDEQNEKHEDMQVFARGSSVLIGGLGKSSDTLQKEPWVKRFFVWNMMLFSGAVPLICMIVFLLFAILGTIHVTNYWQGVNGIIDYQDTILTMLKESLTNDNMSGAQTPANPGHDQIDNTASQKQPGQLSDEVQAVLDKSAGITLDNITTVEANKGSFSITANNAILVIVIEFAVAFLGLFILVHYYHVNIVKKVLRDDPDNK